MKNVNIITVKNGMEYTTTGMINFPEPLDHEMPYIEFYGSIGTEHSENHKVSIHVIKSINVFNNDDK